MYFPICMQTVDADLPLISWLLHVLQVRASKIYMKHCLRLGSSIVKGNWGLQWNCSSIMGYVNSRSSSAHGIQPTSNGASSIFQEWLIDLSTRNLDQFVR